jgi:hypothetical protein
MKIVSMAETMQPRCHVPTTSPVHVSQYPSTKHPASQLLVRHTCDPRIAERTLVDNVKLRKPVEELLNGQKTAHNTLRITKTSAPY